jgi:virginiamycin A acetyltransferase
VQVLAGGDHGVSRLSTYAFSLLDNPPRPEREPRPAQSVKVGNDVWIGSNAIPRGPLTIGDGAIVGAGAVVVADVPPYAVVGGVPARVIRTRLPEEAVAFMEEARWWEWQQFRMPSRWRCAFLGEAT